MKKSLGAVLVILLSLIGANALAAKMDFAVKKVAIESSDCGSCTNGTSGHGDGTGGKNMVTREK